MAILESSDFGGSAPLYGFGGDWDTDEGTYFNFTRSTSGGPGDRAWIRSENIVTAVGTQFYAGWNTSGSPVTAPSTDGSRFVRCRLRVGSGFNATGPVEPWSSKWIMIGDQGGADSDRVIAVLAPRTGDTDINLRVGRNIGDIGTTDATADIELTKGSWMSVQFEARAGSSPYIKLWVDNDTYANPTRSVTGAGLSGWSSALWTSFEFGFYHNHTTASGGNVQLDYAQVELADSFDSSWHSTLNTGSGGGSSSSGTYGVRTLRWR